MTEAPGAAAERDAPSGTMNQAAWFARMAEAALARGRSAEAAGHGAEALRWHDRAHRIAPSDAGIGLALALILIRVGEHGRAATVLRQLSQKQDSREIWLALASVRHRQAAFEAGAGALERALSGHAWPGTPPLDELATQIARGAGYPGWCGCTAEGRLVIHAEGARIQADGAAMRERNVALGVREITVTVGGRPLLGSPLRIASMRRVEGIVAAVAGGLEGWAWHPGAPGRDPVLSVRAGGRVLATVTPRDQDMMAASALARPRRFRVAAGVLEGVAGLVTVTTDGGVLLGSPLTLAPPVPWVGGDARMKPATAEPGRPVAVVVPVFGQAALVAACLDSVLAHLPAGCRVIVIDDASPDGATRAVLAARQGRRVTLIRHAENRGFPASANTGMGAALALRRRHDVVLLNSDTRVTAGWLDGLRALVHADDAAGTATPLSNDATILSYPDVAGGNPVPDDLAQWGAWAAAANRGRAVEIPTAVGFCMYIRHECLRGTGLFREDAFAQGYGEENDFCRRAARLGWTHLAAPGVFVAHAGGQSFGAGRAALIERNLTTLEALHPGYHGLIAKFQKRDPLAPARRRMDVVRWRDGGQPGAVLMITHGSGGGVERVVRERGAAIRATGLRPVVLRSVIAREGAAGYIHGLCQVEEAGRADAFPNLRFRLPRQLAGLARLLAADRPQRIELHHLVGHDHAVTDLARRLHVPLDIHVHDYASFCRRISLVTGRGRYCGEPADSADCDACVALSGHNLSETIAAAALWARSADDFAQARRVVVPSADAAARLRRHFPGLAPELEPLEDDSHYPPVQGFVGAPRHIGIIGGIGVEKGYDVLLACARDAAARDLNLRFTVFGHTSGDDALLDTGRVFVTGPYQETEALALIRSHDVQLAWQPSIWPETWCFTLGLAWRAGLHVAAFDLGAPAERIRQTGRGWLMPLGIPPAAINSLFLGLRWPRGLETTGHSAYQRMSNTV